MKIIINYLAASPWRFLYCHSIAPAVVNNLWQIKICHKLKSAFLLKNIENIAELGHMSRWDPYFLFYFLEEIRTCEAHLSFSFLFFGRNSNIRGKITRRVQDRTHDHSEDPNHGGNQAFMPPTTYLCLRYVVGNINVQFRSLWDLAR
jgi:hypothetical protein